MALLLIVDDDEDDRLLLRTILEQARHEVLVATDGEEALAELEGQSVEAVITDLHMPKVHGLELITIIRELDPPPAIIAVSATGGVQLSMAEALGAAKTLTKPVVPEELLAAVSDVTSVR